MYDVHLYVNVKVTEHIALMITAGDTPAHFASRFGFQEVLRYLLDKGADTQLKNEAGVSCIDASEAKAL